MAHKYRAKKVELDGHRFDSKAEAWRYRELVLLVKAGEVRDLRIHPRYPLQYNGDLLRYDGSKRVVSYIADFAYRCCRTGRIVIEDVKGMDTPLSKLKRAIMSANGNPVVVVSSRSVGAR